MAPFRGKRRSFGSLDARRELQRLIERDVEELLEAEVGDFAILEQVQ